MERGHAPQDRGESPARPRARVLLVALGVSVLLDAHRDVQAEHRPLHGREQPVPLQPPADARAPAVPVRRDAVRALARQHGARGRPRRRDHASARRAGGVRARAPAGRWGERLGIAHLPDVPDPADASLHSALARRRDPRPAGQHLLAGARLPEHDDSVLHLAPDGLLQVHPEGARGRGHGGRPDALRRLPPDGRADLRLRDPDRRDLQRSRS